MQNGSSYGRSRKIIAYLKFALLLLVVIGIPAFLYIRYGADFFSKDSGERIISYLKTNRSLSFILIVFIQMLQVIICVLPGQPIQFAASYMFGIPVGFILSLIGAVIGTCISFILAKILGRDMMHIIFDEEKFENYRRKLNSGKGLMIVLLIYLIPGLPKDLVSYAAGISEMKFRPFILVSTAARSPGMLGSLLLGYFYNRGDYRSIIILVIASLIILIICFIKRKDIISTMDDMEKR